jgi:hypothetical protein
VNTAKQAPERFDLNRIVATVAARHGVLLKADDPAMVLVTINECVLEDSFLRLEERAEALIANMEAAFEAIQKRLSERLADEVRESAAAIRNEIQRDIETAKLEATEAVFRVRTSYSGAMVPRSVAIGAMCGLLLFLCGMALGKLV